MAETKSPVISKVVPVVTEITDHKLNWKNYLDWSKNIRLYLLSIEREDHLTDAPPMGDSREAWIRDDARLILQIRNSIDSEILPALTHCNYVKDLMDYLYFLHFGKGNISRIYEVCKAFYRVEKRDRPLTAYFMDFTRVYEEMKQLMPPTKDIKVQKVQQEQLAIVSFLMGLPLEYETVRSHILSSATITSLQDIFFSVLQAENLSPPPSNVSSSALANRGSWGNKDNLGLSHLGSPRPKGATQDSNGIMCYYCKEPGHTKRTCRKLLNKQQRNGSTHLASSNDEVIVSAAEYAKFLRYQESLQRAPPFSNALDATDSHDEVDYW